MRCAHVIRDGLGLVIARRSAVRAVRLRALIGAKPNSRFGVLIVGVVPPPAERCFDEVAWLQCNGR